MPNHTGAGWLVHAQDDRGLFYENFVLALLASRSCVGWHWFKYQDNDPDDPHAEASNRINLPMYRSSQLQHAI